MCSISVSWALEKQRSANNRRTYLQTLDTLWSRPDIGLRKKTLWRMLSETAARANEILAVNIEDLDLVRKRAVVSGKGGHREVVIWSLPSS